MNDIEANRAQRMATMTMNDHELVEANQSYGALTEGLYIAGFTFERAMANVLGLLKGDGWRRVGPGYDDINEFVRDLRLDRRATPGVRRARQRASANNLQPSNRRCAGG